VCVCVCVCVCVFMCVCVQFGQAIAGWAIRSCLEAIIEFSKAPLVLARAHTHTHIHTHTHTQEHSERQRLQSGADEILKCDVSLCVFSGLRRVGPVGPHGGAEEHVHRDAVLDGPGGHRLRREPRSHVRLQGASNRPPFFCVFCG